MKNKVFHLMIVSCLTSFISCSQDNSIVESEVVKPPKSKEKTITPEPHRYGGWYCPDNLNGFPAVDITNWKDVPVVNGRMATKEETQNVTSLIFVDTKKYPNAKPLDMVMPQLAKFYNQSSRREELIIVIQAINVDNDSIVGFRYLNGGNGSAKLSEVQLLSNNEIEKISSSRFIVHDIKINASQDVIWEIITESENAKNLLPTFNQKNQLKTNWRKTSNVNYHYPKTGNLTSAYANKLYGSFYIQNDYDRNLYSQKFLLLEDTETKITEFKIVCGPYDDDFDNQKQILINWAKKVKELSEKR